MAEIKKRVVIPLSEAIDMLLSGESLRTRLLKIAQDEIEQECGKVTLIDSDIKAESTPVLAIYCTAYIGD